MAESVVLKCAVPFERIDMKNLAISVLIAVAIIASIFWLLVGNSPSQVNQNGAVPDLTTESNAKRSPVSEKLSQDDKPIAVASVDSQSGSVEVLSSTRVNAPSFMAQWNEQDIQDYREYLFSGFGLPIGDQKDSRLYFAISQMGEEQLERFISEVIRDDSETESFTETTRRINELPMSKQRTALLIEHRERMIHKLIASLRASGVVTGNNGQGEN